MKKRETNVGKHVSVIWYKVHETRNYISKLLARKKRGQAVKVLFTFQRRLRNNNLSPRTGRK